MRLRDEAASVSTDGILIVEISRSEMVGQPRQSYFNCAVDSEANNRETAGSDRWGRVTVADCVKPGGVPFGDHIGVGQGADEKCL